MPIYLPSWRGNKPSGDRNLSGGWDDFSTLQRLIALVGSSLLLLQIVYVPHRIPTTGEVVFAWFWDSPEYEDPENKQSVLDMLNKEEAREADPDGEIPEFFRSLYMRTAPSIYGWKLLAPVVIFSCWFAAHKGVAVYCDW